MNIHFWRPVTKALLVCALMFFMFAMGQSRATEAPINSYCLGEWTTQAETYCQRVMIYAGSLVFDHNTGRPIKEVRAEIPLAVITYLIPAELAENFIKWVYQHPKGELTPQLAGVYLFGGCIDDFVYLQSKGNDEAIELTNRSQSE